MVYTAQRRDAGVVDRAALEMRCGGNVTVGSNPTLSEFSDNGHFRYGHLYRLRFTLLQKLLISSLMGVRGSVDSRTVGWNRRRPGRLPKKHSM